MHVWIHGLNFSTSPHCFVPVGSAGGSIEMLMRCKPGSVFEFRVGWWSTCKLE